MPMILRSAAAVAAGYILLVLLSTLVQEVWLGGVSYRDSNLATLILAGIFTPIAGVVAGFATATIARRRPLLHVLPICLAIALETTVLYRTGKVDGPLWFEALAGATLIGGVVLGAAARHYLAIRKRGDAKASAP
jgi:hypothetical protein